MKNKKELRKKAKDIRKTLNIERISKDIIVKIENFEPFQQAKNVMIFYPLENEINLLALLKHSEKNFYLLRTINDDIEACPYKIEDET